MNPLLLSIQILTCCDSLTANNPPLFTSYPAQSIHDTFNIAINGTSSGDWVENGEEWFGEAPLEYRENVSILVGSINVLQDSFLDSFEEDLHLLIDFLTAEGYQDIVISIPPYFAVAEGSLELDMGIDLLAGRILSVILDRQEARLGVDYRLLALTYVDCCHPDTMGQAQMAQAWDEVWTVPEPSSALQMVTGIGIVALLKKWRAGNGHQVGSRQRCDHN